MKSFIIFLNGSKTDSVHYMDTYSLYTEKTLFDKLNKARYVEEQLRPGKNCYGNAGSNYASSIAAIVTVSLTSEQSGTLTRKKTFEDFLLWPA